MTSAWVAGVLAGAIMGLASQAYWLVVFAYRPPAIFARGGPNSSTGTIVMLGGLLATGGWVLAGALLALVFDAVQTGDSDAPLFPSIGFFTAIVFIATVALMPAMVFMRPWLRHIFVTYLLFTGLFGLLLPNLVVAVRE